MIPKFKDDFTKGIKPTFQQGNVGMESYGNIAPKRNLISVLSTILFILVLLAIGGAYGYKFYIESARDQYLVNIDNIRERYDEDRITEILRFSTLVDDLKTLDNKRVPLHLFFDELQKNTVTRVNLSSFVFSESEGGESYDLSFSGSSPNLDSLIQQLRKFRQSSALNGFKFSGISFSDDARSQNNYSFTARANYLEGDFITNLNEISPLGTDVFNAFQVGSNGNTTTASDLSDSFFGSTEEEDGAPDDTQAQPDSTPTPDTTPAPLGEAAPLNEEI